MATMLPSGMETFHTEGEGRFYQFLQRVAQPDRSFIAWYTPDIEDREPDFLLYHDDLGLIVFEVKDWALEQIRHADSHQWEVVFEGRLEKRPSPLRQARDYQLLVRQRLSKVPRLCSDNPAYAGKVQVPVEFGVVFPNINKYEYASAGLGDVVDVARTLFHDDLRPESDLSQDRTGERFLARLKEGFVPRFAFQLQGRDKDALRHALFPEVKIEVPPRGEGEDRDRLRLFDHHQEILARKWDGGHRVLLGPPGSGKTLVLVHKIRLLLRYNPGVRRVLLVCYNIALVPYLKRLVASQGAPLGDRGVDVCHFFELCERVVGEKVAFEKEDGDYYDLVVAEALTRVADSGVRYDAVLVDEGQDFSDDMLRVVTGVLNPDTDHLTVALDEHQDLYGKRRNWSSVGIRAKGRVHRLHTVYRATRQLAHFASRFAGDEALTAPESNQLPLFQDSLSPEGPEPEFPHLGDLDAVVAHVAQACRVLVHEQRMPPAEIGVLYASRRAGCAEGPALPQRLETALSTQGVLSRWASEDVRSKRTFDITTQSVAISTIHTAKGMDFSCVFLVGLDALESGRWTPAQLVNLAYVGLTRARHRLVVPYCQENFLMKKLLACR